MYCPAFIFKGSCGIIVNYIRLLSSSLRYLKTSLTLGNFLPLIRATTLLRYNKSTPSYTEVVIKIFKEI
jgi:hypothetical protein